MTNYYQTLGVPSNATVEQIKAAYRELAKHFHPDKHSNSEFFKRRFQEVQHAYEFLTDDEKRKNYDRQQTGGNAKSTYDATVNQLTAQITKLKTDLVVKDRIAIDAITKQQEMEARCFRLTNEALHYKSAYGSSGDAKKVARTITNLRLGLVFTTIFAALSLFAAISAEKKNAKTSGYLNDNSLIDMNIVRVKLDTLDAHENYSGIITLMDSLIHSGVRVDSTVLYKGFNFNRADLLLHRGYGKYKSDNDTGAVRDFTRCIITRKEPIAYPYYMRSVLKRDMGDLSGARADISKAIELDPKDSRSKIHRADMRYNSNDFAGAIKDYRGALKYDSQNAETLFFLGNSYEAMSRKDSACIMWRRAGDLGSKDAFEKIESNCN